MGDSGNKVSSSTIMVSSGYYDPVDIDEKKLNQGCQVTQENKIIRMSPDYTGYFGFGRWDGKIKSHTGYDYISPVGTPVQAVQFGYIERIRFGRAPIKYYFEKKDDKQYYKRKWFTCPLFELFKQGTNHFDHNICKECRNKYFTYAEKTPAKEYKAWKTYQIISERINGPRIDVSTLEISEQTANKQLVWTRISAECFGVQLWLKIRNYVTHDSGYYAYYAHLSEFNSAIFTSVITSKFSIHNSNKENEGDTTIILDKPIQVDAGEIIGKSGCTGNALNMVGDDQHLHFECRKKIENVAGSQISPNRIVKTEFKIKNIVDNNKAPFEKIEHEHIIEYRAANRWKVAETYNKRDKYLDMRWDEEHKKDPQLTRKDFDTFMRPIIIKEEWVRKKKWEEWEKFKTETINLENTQWNRIIMETESQKALEDFRKEHILIVSDIKGVENSSSYSVS